MGCAEGSTVRLAPRRFCLSVVGSPSGSFASRRSVRPGAPGGLKDKTCWFCGDFSALQRGKFTILVGRVCLDYVNTEASWVCGCPMVRDGLAACANDLDSNASRM